MPMNLRKKLAALMCALFVSASAGTFSVTAFAAGTVYAKTTADLNLRYGAGMNYGVITVMDENVKVTVLDRSNPNWLRIKLPDGTIGYSSADYLDIITDGYTTTAVNVRKGASTDYTVITTVPKNTKVDIIRYAGSSWAYIRLPSGITGYMCTDYITYTALSSTQTSTSVSSASAPDIKLSVSSKKIVVGTSCTLKVSNNQGTVSWTSSDTKIAKVDSNGKVTAVAAGSAVITATDTKTKKTAKCTFTTVKTDVTVKRKDSITLSSSSITLDAGSSKVVTANKSSDSIRIKWSSSNAAVACVRGGRISGLSAGTAVITASDSTGTITAKCNVKVNAVSKGSLYLSRTSFSTTAGKDFILESENGSAWSTSDRYVATVADSGIVHTNKPGKVAITYSDGQGHKAVCVVTVGKAAPVRAVYNSPNVAKVGQTETLVAVTDKTVSSVRFKVNNGTSSTFVTSTSKTEKNGRYIWTAQYQVINEGNFTTTAYATRNGKESTCEDANGDFYVSNRSSSVSYLGKHYSTDDGIGFIREKEGLTAKIRDDSLAPGNLTVGYGCVIGEGNAFYNDMIFEEANALLIHKLNHGDITSVLNNFFIDYKLKCSQQQFDAITSFAYNLGPYWMNIYDFGTEFREFSSVYNGGTAVKDLKDMNRNIIIDNMTQFTMSNGVNVWGLLYRRIDELEIFFYNDYTNDGKKNKYGFRYPAKGYI